MAYQRTLYGPALQFPGSTSGTLLFSMSGVISTQATGLHIIDIMLPGPNALCVAYQDIHRSGQINWEHYPAASVNYTFQILLNGVVLDSMNGSGQLIDFTNWNLPFFNAGRWFTDSPPILKISDQITLFASISAIWQPLPPLAELGPQNHLGFFFGAANSFQNTTIQATAETNLLVSNPDPNKPCLCGNCLKLSVAVGGGTASALVFPPGNLFNPSACCPNNNIWFISAGSGNQPGIFVDTSANSSGQFTWTFTVNWGGPIVLTETGTISFNPSASFFIPFSDPNWKLNNPESGWNWYYSGAFNSSNYIGFDLNFNIDPKLSLTHWPGPTWYSCPSSVGFRIKA